MGTAQSNSQSKEIDITQLSYSGWYLDCERIDRENPYLIIFFHGKFSFDQKNKKIILDQLHAHSENNYRVVVDMSDVKYISTVFLDSLVGWAGSRKGYGLFTGITGMNQSMKTIVKKIGGFKCMHAMPSERNEWEVLFNKKFNKSFMSRIKRLFG